MKGDLTLRFLEAISEAATGAVDFFDVFLSVGYGASIGKFEYELAKRARDRERRQLTEEKERRMRERYYNLLSYLRRDNLITENKSGEKRIFYLTQKGKQKIRMLRERKQRQLPEARYAKEPSVAFTIIAFDIPERERRKRNWLRAVLKALEFKMIQKSVWIGKIKVPRELVEDIKRLNLLEAVEIFEISKTGTLRHLAES